MLCVGVTNCFQCGLDGMCCRGQGDADDVVWECVMMDAEVTQPRYSIKTEILLCKGGHGEGG